MCLCLENIIKSEGINLHNFSGGKLSIKNCVDNFGIKLYLPFSFGKNVYLL
jgi:hypothetical protein